ncbi:unnamed protein product [Penicillium egyptiacum]|uniref:Fe2OG dioxygenase domain-containing protein n=1 Tax=Penicillium egyptiacum TaxID=1303716 RepID=A0A9W4KFJ3_9EURO|nr:unnamed protein product [Penicillium egyptiacum]
MGSFEASQQADLKSISLFGLLEGNLEAANDLVSACKEKGFFYLDFRDASTCKMLTQVDDLITVGREVFKLSLEEKEQYSTEKHLPSRLQGCIHNNGLWGDDTLELPLALEENLPLIKTWMSEVHGYTECILSILSKALNLPYNLKDCHRKDVPSSANMAMLNYLPWGSTDEKVGNMAHTDMGTLTVVFTKNDGLQVFEPETEQWYYIKPRSGHAVVNVGDSLRFLSNGALASNLHRVVPPANPEGLDKFSCIYFLRPEFDAKFTSRDGKVMNSVEWHNQKYALFREASLDAKKHGAMLTGRNGYLGATTETV